MMPPALIEGAVIIGIIYLYRKSSAQCNEKEIRKPRSRLNSGVPHVRCSGYSAAGKSNADTRPMRFLLFLTRHDCVR
jgi:hypothetical protein